MVAGPTYMVTPTGHICEVAWSRAMPPDDTVLVACADADPVAAYIPTLDKPRLRSVEEGRLLHEVALFSTLEQAQSLRDAWFPEAHKKIVRAARHILWQKTIVLCGGTLAFFLAIGAVIAALLGYIHE